MKTDDYTFLKGQVQRSKALPPKELSAIKVVKSHPFKAQYQQQEILRVLLLVEEGRSIKS